MRDRPELSLIMPAYNEGDTIKEVIDKVDRVVRQTGLRYELIVVDDGSVDDTRMKAINYANNNAHVKVIGYRENMGKGYAIKTGFARAAGDTVIFMDSDLDIDPGQIARYLEALRQGEVVIASKWHPQSKVTMPFIRKFLSHCFNWLVKLLTEVKVKDTQTGLKAVKRDALERVFSKLVIKRYAFDVELLALANLYNLKVVELPVNVQIDRLFSFRDAWRMFLDLLGIAYRLKMLKSYQCASVAKATELPPEDKA